MILTVISVGECGARWEDFRQPLLKPRDLRLILDRVGSCGRLGPAGLVLSFVCLPGLLHARDASGDVIRESGGRIYTIHLSESRPVAKIELSVAQTSAEWEVTAVYDSTACEIHCSWRRKRDAFGPAPRGSFLLPPIATIRIYANFVSQSPAVIVVDPAGLGLPGAMGDTPLTPAAACIPARRLIVAALSQREDTGPPNRPRAHFLSSTNQPEVTSAASLPLRI
jgi:hypothetical protein